MSNKRVIKIDCAEKATETKVILPNGRFESDWFKCGNCGYAVRIKTLSNTITCSECGGTMNRI